MTTTITNGEQRRTLAKQLDRLEAILDTMGPNLNGAVAGAVQQAVAMAVRQAVQEAVQAVLAQVLTNPDLRAALAPTPVPDYPPRGGLAEGLARAWGWARGRLGAGLRLARLGVGALWRRGTPLGPVKGAVAVAAGVGALGTAVYFGGPWLAAAWGCAAGVVMTQVASCRAALRRVLSLPPDTN
jgi:hypothetical protein